MTIQLYGTVEHGKQYGRKIGFPTINILNSLHVDSGIYAGRIFIHGVQYDCVIYVSAKRGEILEAHVFDFNDDVYGVLVMVQVLVRLRDDKMITNPNELHDIIKNDCISAKEYIKNNKCLQE